MVPYLLFSIAYTFRKEGHVKVIEYDLSRKQKGSLTRKRPNVLNAERNQSYSKTKDEKTAPAEDAMDVDPPDEVNDNEMDTSEEEGEDVMSDKEANPDNLPRAANGKIKTSRGRNERVMPPEECRAHLRRLFRNEAIMCALVFGKHGPFAPLSPDQLSFASADMFFLDVIPVAPTRFRPPAKMGEILFEHPQNELLAKVLQTTYRMRDINLSLQEVSSKEGHDETARRKLMGDLLNNLVQLQVDVNSFMDSNKNPQIVRQGKLPPAGVKQGLEKKEGLFRKNMMVSLNYSLSSSSFSNEIIGQTCQLCCPLRHLPRYQHRAQ